MVIAFPWFFWTKEFCKELSSNDILRLLFCSSIWNKCGCNTPVFNDIYENTASEFCIKPQCITTLAKKKKSYTLAYYLKLHYCMMEGWNNKDYKTGIIYTSKSLHLFKV